MNLNTPDPASKIRRIGVVKIESLAPKCPCIKPARVQGLAKNDFIIRQNKARPVFLPAPNAEFFLEFAPKFARNFANFNHGISNMVLLILAATTHRRISRPNMGVQTMPAPAPFHHPAITKRAQAWFQVKTISRRPGPANRLPQPAFITGYKRMSATSCMSQACHGLKLCSAIPSERTAKTPPKT